MQNTEGGAMATVRELARESLVSTSQMYLAHYGLSAPLDPESSNIRLQSKIAEEYGPVKQSIVALSKSSATKLALSSGENDSEASAQGATAIIDPQVEGSTSISSLLDTLPENNTAQRNKSTTALVAFDEKLSRIPEEFRARSALILRQREKRTAKPDWHAPWKLMRVISGHLGWVRCVSVDPANEWFVTGSGDRTLKIWDLASGTLRITLTGHISAVRGVCVSARHPYLFSVGEDKLVKNWDLETNKVIRAYHGHLSGVYSCELHPTLDLLITGGRDSTARVWDIRTKAQVRVLAGHTNTVSSIACQPTDPQIITGSHDSTIRCWDLASGKVFTTITNHKKSVRALKIHPSEYTFVSGSADNIKVFKCPDNSFLRNFSGHNAIVNTLAINQDNVLVSAADDGSIKFWDWKTSHCFQSLESQVQPGSLDSEAGVFAMAFDKSGSRLITCEADKTIKIYKEDADADEESFPLNWEPSRKRKRF